MPAFRVILNGSNFLVDMDGVVARHGFYTHRDVSAQTPEDAELAAVEMLRAEPGLRALVKNLADDPPVIDVEEIREIDGTEPSQSGLVWYPEDVKRWWQFWRR